MDIFIFGWTEIVSTSDTGGRGSLLIDIETCPALMCMKKSPINPDGWTQAPAVEVYVYMTHLSPGGRKIRGRDPKIGSSAHLGMMGQGYIYFVAV